MSADGALPPGVRHDDVSDRRRPWLDDDESHHAGDDDDWAHRRGDDDEAQSDAQARGGTKTHREIASPDALAETKRVAPDVIAASEQAARSTAGSSPAALALDDDDMGPPDGPVLRRRPRPEREPERLACRQCGQPWDEPRLSPDGVCPICREDLEER